MPVLPEVGSIRWSCRARFPGLFERLDHGDADTVLHARDRIEEFELGQQVGLDALFLGELVQADDGRVADGFEDGIVDVAPAWSEFGFSSLSILSCASLRFGRCYRGGAGFRWSALNDWFCIVLIPETAPAAANPRSRSAMISSICSSPTDRRT